MKRLLACLAAALAVTACSSGSHHRAAPPPPAPTTTSTVPVATDSPFSWNRDFSATLAVGGGATATLSALVPAQVNQPWRAFGTQFDATGAPRAAVWSSPDAQTWTAAALVAGETASQVDAAVDFRGTTAAIGATGSGATEQAAAWISRSGGAFTPADVPVTSRPSTMQQVTAGALGFFATGTDDGHFALWESNDGQSWTEVAAAEHVITSQPGATVDALVSIGGQVYAAGWVQPGSVPQAAVWSSSDGLDWTQVNATSTSFSNAYGEAIYSLAPLDNSASGGSGLVAVGAIDGGSGWEPASWITPNGDSWSLPSTAFPGVPNVPAGATDLGPSGGTAALAVASIPTGDGSPSMVAAGGGPYGQAAWTSDDGLHWTSLSMPPADAGSGAWSAGLVASSGTTTVVADSQPGQPYLLTDAAGVWNEPSPAALGPIRTVAVPVSLRQGPSGLVLTVQVVDRPQVIGPPTVSVQTYVSADGQSWQAATPAQVAQVEPATEPAPGALSVTTAGGWMAVSTGAGGVPLVYQSADGRTWTEQTTLAPPFTSTAPTPTSTGPTTTTNAAATTTSIGGASVTLPPRSEAPGYSVDGLCSFTAAVATGSTTTATAPTPTPTSTSTTTTIASARTDGPAATAEIAVGAGQFVPTGQVSATTGAAAWHGADGHWSLATVSQSLPAGSGQLMTGCLVDGTSLYSYGVAAEGSGAPVPALWRSTDGSSWSRQAISNFDAGDPAPLMSVSAAGKYWSAVATSDPRAAPFDAGVFGAAGPGAGIGSDAAFGPAPSTENGADGLWLSADSGNSWQPVDAATSPWAGVQDSELDLTGFAGATTPVVVGVVDGQLAVWTGTAAAPATSSP